MSTITPINRSNLSKKFLLKLFETDNSNLIESSFLKYMDLRRANNNIIYQKIKKLINSQTFDNISPKKQIGKMI